MTTPTPHGAPELLPCPFCGGICQASQYSSFDGWTVKCAACDVSGGEFLHYANAIAAWNRRAIQQAAGAVPEGLHKSWDGYKERCPHGVRWENHCTSCATGREAGSSDHLVPCAGGGVTQPLTDEQLEADAAKFGTTVEYQRELRAWQADVSAMAQPKIKRTAHG